MFVPHKTTNCRRSRKNERFLIAARGDVILAVADIVYLAEPNADKVAAYREMLRRGLKPEPIIVWRTEGCWRLIDGLHRLSAARDEGRMTIEAEPLPP